MLGPFRVRRRDGDPRLTVAQQLAEDFINWSYERDPEHYDAMVRYHMTYWMLYGGPLYGPGDECDPED